MIIAIYHCQDIHFEMIGYLVEYCIKYNFVCHIYQRSQYKDGRYNIPKSYMEWYLEHFKDSIHLIHVIYSYYILEEINYDAIFLATDDALEIPYIEQYKSKIISINHFYTIRNDKVAIDIGTRFFSNRPEIPFAIPCFNIISEYDKRHITKNQTRVQVVFIGRFNIPSSKTFSLFNNFSDIDFHIVRWKKIETAYFKFLKKTPNIYIHAIETNDDLVDILSKAHYCFLHPMTIMGYHFMMLSGVLHYALSCLVKCIIPLTWNIRLNFTSFLEYDDLILSMPGKQLNLTVQDYIDSIEKINLERFNCIKHRNNVFDNAIKQITNITAVCKNDSSYVSYLFSELYITLPKFLVTVGNISESELLLFKDDFNEIVCINDNVFLTHSLKFICKNISHINIQYDSDIIRSLDTNIKNNDSKPILFFLDASLSEFSDCANEQLIKQLIIISTSDINDNIIIIKNCKIITGDNFTIFNNDTRTSCLSEDIIYKSYNKPCHIIVFKYLYDGILIIPAYNEITKNVFQVCIKPYNHTRIPPIVIENIKNKSLNFNYSLYTDKEIMYILQNYSNNIVEKYNSFWLPHHRKDFFQLLYLYSNGGIHIDLDQEQLVPLNDILYNASFISMIPVLKKDGLCIGFMGASKHNCIVKEMINKILTANVTEYITLCKISGKVLKDFMGVSELNEGIYKINGQIIVLLQEIWDGPGNYKSCRGVFQETVILNSRYSDYPWNLNT